MRLALASVDRLEIRSRHRQARDCDCVASARIPIVLKMEDSSWRRPSVGVSGGSRPYPKNESGESSLACSANSWGTNETRRSGLASNSRQVHGPAPEATVGELRTFLKNDTRDLVAADCFIFPTNTFRPLFVCVILSHGPRRLVHFAVTTNPAAEWTARQLREVFLLDSVHSILLRDRDGCYAEKFHEAAEWLGSREVLTALHLPGGGWTFSSS
jgi:hypothetical protein